MTPHTPTAQDDSPARARALSVNESFIVEAPAGSGKTELLTQRYLALLATVNAPEEIVAITFTRKAAGEMRNRIIDKLDEARQLLAQGGGDNLPPHQHTTFQLARAALARNAQQGWQLLEHPGRLRVQTIDSFCASLIQRMPYLAHLGQVSPSDDPESLYREAVRSLLDELESAEADTPLLATLQTALAHLDNRLDHLEDLLCSMLAQRDQWLPHLAGAHDSAALRREIESGFAGLVAQRREALLASLPPGLQSSLMPLARFAAETLLATAPDNPICSLAHWHTPLCGDEAEMPVILGLRSLLLTGKGEWRKKLDKNAGFPADKETKHHKEAMQAVLEGLAGETSLQDQLASVADWPPARFADSQWQALAAILELLRQSAARLWLTFLQQGQTDFAEIQQRALQALGEEEAPTDLALQLDYQIRHLLVDEFQDTSFAQHHLLKKLTAGWQAGDGRTLFVVGDPMQSIYLFRQAQVGLFLEVLQLGLGGQTLTPLQLTRNFRSEGGIVEWVNQTFRTLFPTHDEVSEGAVASRQALAVKPAAEQPAVVVHPFGPDSYTEEADTIVRLIREAEAEGAHSIAVLVRTRGALSRLVPALQAAHIRFAAVEIDPLATRQPIADALALTRALLHPADRVHWLATLRAPWCGLTLADLTLLCADAENALIPELLNDPDRLATLSAEGQQRATRLWQVLGPLLHHKGRLSEASRVRRAWLQLGGPATLPDAAAEVDMDAYWHLLAQLESQQALQLDDLPRHINKLYAAPDTSGQARVQLMTIHKSKGLEFDVVILPGLGRKPRVADSPLFIWAEIEHKGQEKLLMAPVKETGVETASPHYRFIQKIRQQREAFELTRLLYVACTRAVKRLHLLGAASVNDSGASPASGSLLATLWPVLSSHYQNLSPQEKPEADPMQPLLEGPGLIRLPASWPFPQPQPVLTGLGDGIPQGWTNPEPGPIFTSAQQIATVAGSLAHRVLELLAQTESLPEPEAYLAKLQPLLLQQARQQGLSSSQAAQAVEKASTALARTLADADGRWLLQSHEDSHCEWALTEETANGLVQHIIDRSFVDTDGTRWIIDYKTDYSEGQDESRFIAERTTAHRPQLERYRTLLARHETRPIRLGLYFLMLPKLVTLE